MRKLSTSKGGTAAAWGAAAAAVPDRRELLAHAEAMLGGKACQPFPPSWDVLGPMPIGKNEVDGDPLAAHGGAWAHWMRHHNVSAATVRSELAPGGLVGWRAVKPAPDGALGVGWGELPWGALVQALGQRAVLEELSGLKDMCEVLVVVTSSFGEGDPPDNYSAFLLKLLAPAVASSPACSTIAVDRRN